MTRTAMNVAAIVGVMLLVGSVECAWGQESRPESPPANGIPDRYRRQVAPTPSTYWRAPALGVWHLMTPLWSGGITYRF
jgi:hypothetical protein